MTEKSKFPKYAVNRITTEVAQRSPMSTADQASELRAIARALVARAATLEGISLREVV